MAKGKPTGNAGKGRVKGVPNKMTRDLKAAILEAAEQAGESFGPDGMVSYLKAQATLTPGPFMALLGKVLPTTLAGEIGVKVSHEQALDELDGPREGDPQETAR